MSFLAILTSRLGGYITAAIAVIGLLAGVYRAGKKSARTDSAETQLENVKVRNEIDQSIARAKPGSSRERLRNEWSRD
jgi:hypothetical protein